MRFLYPYLLFLLIPVALLVGMSFVRTYQQRKKLKKFGETELVKQLMPDLSLRRKLIRDIVLGVALALLILALARPQMGAKSETVTREGVELMVCLDVSNSMLSDDVKPSRLDRAKAIVSRIVDKLSNNKIGLIYFAGDAYIQLPITADFVSAKMFLSGASPDLIQAQGTAIGQAVRLATRSFSSDEKVKRAIVIITDGENHEGDAEEAVRSAHKEDIMVNVIGIGTNEGGPIPLEDGSYLYDNEGKMVVTRLNAQMGQELAGLGGGAYIQANDVSGTVRILEQALDKLEKSEMDTTVYTAYNEVYHFFLIPAILLILFDLIALDRKNRYFRRINLFD